MKQSLCDKRFDEITGKIHIPCPHSEKSGVFVHVVIKDGYCYRSEQCLVFGCKLNRLQGDIGKILSIVW